jgi:hypothetical protein
LLAVDIGGMHEPMVDSIVIGPDGNGTTVDGVIVQIDPNWLQHSPQQVFVPMNTTLPAE